MVLYYTYSSVANLFLYLIWPGLSGLCTLLFMAYFISGKAKDVVTPQRISGLLGRNSVKLAKLGHTSNLKIIQYVDVGRLCI